MTTATAPQPLTDRQREIFTYIWDYTCREGFQPSIREIGRHFGITSPNGMVAHFKFMERKGWLRRPDGEKSRALRFLYTPDGRPFRGFRAIED